MSHAIASHRQRHGEQGNRRNRDVERSLDDGVEPLQWNIIEVDDGNAVQIFESGAKGNELQQVGDHLHVDALSARRLDEIQQLHVLLERQRDVQVVDALTPHDLGGFLEAAEQRQAAIAEMIAASPVVDETDNLVAQLAMFEHLVSHHATELACAGDQDSPKADPCNPSPLAALPAPACATGSRTRR